MDVIALHARGFENAVATLGTAITPNHARIFAKYTKKVVIAYDSDAAGQTAADKAMRLLSEAGVEVRVLRMSGAKDPDEYIKLYGKDAFSSIIKESKSRFDFKLDKILAAHDITQTQELIRASGEVAQIIANVYSNVERELYISAAAKRMNVSADSLKGDVERIRRKLIREHEQKESQKAVMSAKGIDDRINTEASKNIKARAAEELVLGLMLMYPEYRAKAANGEADLSPDDFSTEFSRRVFTALCELENSEGGFSKALLGQYFTPDEIGRIESMEQKRRTLAANGEDVFTEGVKNVKAEKNKSDDLDAIFARRREEAKKLRENKK